MNQQNQPQPDLQALALTKAIRAQETGGNYTAVGDKGTSTGAYQFQPDTWKLFSKQILGDPNAPMTPENQNAVAYGMVKTWKDQGLGPAEIAAKWNSGSSNGWENKVGTNSQGVDYNVPKYVQGVVSNFKQIYPQVAQQYGQQAPQPGGLIPTANADTAGTVPTQSPSVGGFVQNIFSSAGNLASNLGQAILHPVDTLSNLAGTIGGAVEKPFGIQNEDTQKFDNMVGYLKQRYGGDSLGEVINNISKTAYNDPVGTALDVSTLVDGVGSALGAIGKTADIAELSKAADALKGVAETINPVATGAKVAGKAANTVLDMGKSTYGKLIGLNSGEDVTNIIKNYQDFSKAGMENLNRSTLAEDFGNAIDRLDNAMGENGKAYGSIGSRVGMVSVPENWIKDVLQNGSSVAEEGGKAIPFKINLKTNPDGTLKVVADTKSFTRDPREIAAIQNFVDTWGNKTQLTPQEFLNMRSDLAKMGKFGRDIGKNDAAELVGRALRADANKTMRPQPALKGLKELDETQAPLIQQFNQARKDFLTRNANGEYEFKPNAINKIANATGKGKDLLLSRMEQISPGITKRIQMVKTAESIESAFNIKTGTYAKAGLEIGALLHGNVPVVIGAILTHPSIAIPLLRGLGWSANKIAPVTHFLKLVAGGYARTGAAAEVLKTVTEAENQGKNSSSQSSSSPLPVSSSMGDRTSQQTSGTVQKQPPGKPQISTQSQ